jgi:cytochrome c biogenesis protein CcmG, thiol:disulfide interchange protein DsbE
MKVNRFWIPLVGFLALAGVFAVALKRAPPAGTERVIPSALIGKPASAFTLPSVLDPQTNVTLEQFKGRWVLLNVWATWCVECRAEHQVLLDVQRDGKVEILGLDYKDEDAAANEWLQKLGNPYSAVASDPEGRVALDYGVYGAPENFLIDPDGIIVRKHVGALSTEVWARDFQPLLKDPS